MAMTDAGGGTEAMRAWIVATLEAVPGMGRVHGRERRATRASDLRALYVPDGGRALSGAFVRRVGRVETRVGASRTWRVVTRWQVRLYAAFDDAAASEPAFDALLDRAAAAFRRAVREAGRRGPLARAAAADGPGEDAAAGLALDDSKPKSFAGVLCHAARLSLATVHYEDEAAGER